MLVAVCLIASCELLMQSTMIIIVLSLTFISPCFFMFALMLSSIINYCRLFILYLKADKTSSRSFFMILVFRFVDEDGHHETTLWILTVFFTSIESVQVLRDVNRLPIMFIAVCLGIMVRMVFFPPTLLVALTLQVGFLKR